MWLLLFNLGIPLPLTHHPTHGMSVELTERKPKWKFSNWLHSNWILIFWMTLDEWPYPACFVFSSEEKEFSWLTPKVFLVPRLQDTRAGLTCLLAQPLPGTRPWGFPEWGLHLALTLPHCPGAGGISLMPTFLVYKIETMIPIDKRPSDEIRGFRGL